MRLPVLPLATGSTKSRSSMQWALTQGTHDEEEEGEEEEEIVPLPALLQAHEDGALAPPPSRV